MNESEIDCACQRYKDHPVLGPATKLLSDLRHSVNGGSDGWCYWPKPSRAAKKLMELIQDPITATPEKLKKAITPIRSFCTRYPQFPFPGTGA